MPPKVSSEQPLIFDWEKARSRLGKLLLALLVVVAGLALFFYVFRVVYPQSERFTPVPHQVVMLNAADPLSGAIMNKVRDVDFLLLPPSNGQGGGVSLQDHAPVFHPSFEGHELRLQDLPHRPFTAPSPRLLEADDLTLPPLDLSELKAKASGLEVANKIKSRSARLRMQFHDLPQERLPRSLPDLAEVPTMDPANYRFSIGVAEDGRVTFALPLGTPDLPEVGDLLTERVMRLRFAPLGQEQAGNDSVKDKVKKGAVDMVQWGEVSFEWSESP